MGCQGGGGVTYSRESRSETSARRRSQYGRGRPDKRVTVCDHGRSGCWFCRRRCDAGEGHRLRLYGRALNIRRSYDSAGTVPLLSSSYEEPHSTTAAGGGFRADGAQPTKHSWTRKIKTKQNGAAAAMYRGENKMKTTTHVLQLIVQDVGAHVRHHLPARGVLGALGGVQLVEVAEADVVALADGVEVLHVAIRQESFELITGEETNVNRPRGRGKWRINKNPCRVMRYVE